VDVDDDKRSRIERFVDRLRKELPDQAIEDPSLAAGNEKK
jgi:hypothetical protein